MSTAGPRDERITNLSSAGRFIVPESGVRPIDHNSFLSTLTGRFGAETTIKPFAGPGGPSGSSVVTVGTAPSGYGQVVLWDPSDTTLAVVAYLNAGDDLGVMISGAQQGDQISVYSASGICSFADDTKNDGVASIIGLLGSLVAVGVAIFSSPAAAPFIEEGAAYAAQMFPESQKPSKFRDPFGIEPGTGAKCKEEGGVLISLPQAGGNYYSGDDDHKELWIKSPGDRIPPNYPPQIPGGDAFFLWNDWPSFYAGNQALASTGGDFIIYPWDWNFGDNNGSYRLDITLTRAAAVPPSPVIQ
jgi:hypothetical protein